MNDVTAVSITCTILVLVYLRMLILEREVSEVRASMDKANEGARSNIAELGSVLEKADLSIEKGKKLESQLSGIVTHGDQIITRLDSIIGGTDRSSR